MSLDLTEQDWLKLRRKCLGASEVASVLGLSPWTTPYELWLSKTQGVNQSGSMATELGHALQPVIARYGADKYGWLITAEEVFATHPVETWAGATPDYLIHSEGEEFLLDCKATRQDYWTDIPEHYKLQLAWQCFVHCKSKAKLAVLHASTKFEVYDFDFEDARDWWPDVFSACHYFWHQHVLKGVPPESSDSADLSARIKAVPGKSVELSEDALQQIETIRETKQQIEQLESVVVFLTDQVKAELGDAEIGCHQGRQLVTWKQAKDSNRFDADTFKKDNPELYGKYLMTKQGNRSFILKKGAVK